MDVFPDRPLKPNLTGPLCRGVFSVFPLLSGGRSPPSLCQQLVSCYLSEIRRGGGGLDVCIQHRVVLYFHVSCNSSSGFTPRPLSFWGPLGLCCTKVRVMSYVTVCLLCTLGLMKLGSFLVWVVAMPAWRLCYNSMSYTVGVVTEIIMLWRNIVKVHSWQSQDALLQIKTFKSQHLVISR